MMNVYNMLFTVKTRYCIHLTNGNTSNVCIMTGVRHIGVLFHIGLSVLVLRLKRHAGKRPGETGAEALVHITRAQPTGRIVLHLNFVVFRTFVESQYRQLSQVF